MLSFTSILYDLFVQLSSLAITFTAQVRTYIYTQKEMLDHTHNHSLCTPKGNAIRQGTPPQIKSQQWFPFQPYRNPALNTKRLVCAPNFHATSGHCCHASQIQASPSQTHPMLSNEELCKPMQRPLYSLCYSKQSMAAVDKEMQSGSPLTPGSLCKQYGELLGTLLITL